ncbi:hypothetical protein HDU91_003911, partial [Kappamyces sp. JEL0680]
TACTDIVFTSQKEPAFSTYKLSSLKKDKKLGIYFESGRIYDETIALLLFNCPDPGCEVVCSGGWKELKQHVKEAHQSVLW